MVFLFIDFAVDPSNCHFIFVLSGVGERAPLAWYERRNIDRWFSFHIVLPVPESPPPAALSWSYLLWAIKLAPNNQIGSKATK